MKWPKENKEAVAMARKELQYNQLLDKISRDISRVRQIFAVFENFYLLIPRIQNT
jgi:hypothetical protein